MSLERPFMTPQSRIQTAGAAIHNSHGRGRRDGHHGDALLWRPPGGTSACGLVQLY